MDDFLKHVPHFRIATLKHALRALDGVSESTILQLTNDEGLEQLERDLLWKAALMELEIRTDDDDGTCRVINPLAEQVFAEATLLALDHVGDRLQWTVA